MKDPLKQARDGQYPSENIQPKHCPVCQSESLLDETWELSGSCKEVSWYCLDCDFLFFTKHPSPYFE